MRMLLYSVCRTNPFIDGTVVIAVPLRRNRKYKKERKGRKNTLDYSHNYA